MAEETTKDAEEKPKRRPIPQYEKTPEELAQEKRVADAKAALAAERTKAAEIRAKGAAARKTRRAARDKAAYVVFAEVERRLRAGDTKPVAVAQLVEDAIKATVAHDAYTPEAAAKDQEAARTWLGGVKRA